MERPTETIANSQEKSGSKRRCHLEVPQITIQVNKSPGYNTLNHAEISRRIDWHTPWGAEMNKKKTEEEKRM